MDKDNLIDVSASVPGFVNKSNYLISETEREEGIEYDFYRSDYSNCNIYSIDTNVAGDIDKLDLKDSGSGRLLDVFGNPTSLFIVKRGYEEYTTYLYGDVQFFLGNSGSNVIEIRIANPAVPYSYSGLKVGSSVDDITNVMGAPLKQVNFSKYENSPWDDMVLYNGINANTNESYISYNLKGARFFLWDNRISAMYIFSVK